MTGSSLLAIINGSLHDKLTLGLVAVACIYPAVNATLVSLA